MQLDDSFIKIGFSLDNKEFYMFGNGKYADRCFVYDKLEDNIVSEDVSLSEGLRQVRELSVFFPSRFFLVFDDVVCPSGDPDCFYGFSSDDVPF